MKSLSRVQLLATPWTAVHQAALSMGFSRQEYWSASPLPSPPHSARSHETQEQSAANLSSVQFISVAQSCPTLCNSMNHSTPGLPVHHQLPEFTETQVHQVGDAIQPSHPGKNPAPGFQMTSSDCLLTWQKETELYQVSLSFLFWLYRVACRVLVP